VNLVNCNVGYTDSAWLLSTILCWTCVEKEVPSLGNHRCLWGQPAPSCRKRLQHRHTTHGHTTLDLTGHQHHHWAFITHSTHFTALGLDTAIFTIHPRICPFLLSLETLGGTGMVYDRTLITRGILLPWGLAICPLLKTDICGPVTRCVTYKSERSSNVFILSIILGWAQSLVIGQLFSPVPEQEIIYIIGIFF